MRILFLADAQSTHTHKWVTGISEKGFEVHLFSLSNPPMNWYNNDIKIYSSGLDDNIKFENEISINKLKYLKAITQIRTIIRLINPDILHSHYASSYGFLGSLTKFHPFILSIWGSDIESFPHKSFIHKILIKHTLNSADKIMATSSYLAGKANEILKSDITIIPFGVDTKIFKPGNAKIEYHNEIVIGTIKSLENVYGIDVLIKAFSIVKKNIYGIPLKLLIVGKGSREMELKEMASSLLNREEYLFQGYVNHNLISDYHNKIDIPVYLSRKESFGVSVIESMACGKSVIATNIGGLKEVIFDGVDGILVQPNNIISAADAIEKLVINSELRTYLGHNGKEKVHKYFNWEDNLNSMISIYYDLYNDKL
jgi:L-malate glycosyltransferase